MKFPWFRSSVHVDKRIAEVQEEIGAIKRDSESIQPMVEEATRRTNESYIAVERVTRAARRKMAVGCALITDLEEGWRHSNG